MPASCSCHLAPEQLLDALRRAARRLDRDLQVVAQGHQSPDHEHSIDHRHAPFRTMAKRSRLAVMHGREYSRTEQPGGGPDDEMRFLRTCDGARIAYWVSTPTSLQGALVLLHGAASNHSRWSELCRTTALREHWALLRPDLRGQGASLDRGRIGMGEWCTDLAALLDAEGLSRAVIVGHCLGANLALRFAARFPARTAGLVLIEPMVPEALAGTMRWIRRLRPALLGLVALTRSFNALGLRRRRLEPLDLEQLDRETRAAYRGNRNARVRKAKGGSRNTPRRSSICAPPRPAPTCRRCSR